LEGIESLAKVFPAYRVTAVDITHSAFTSPAAAAVKEEEEGEESTDKREEAPLPLHLKSMCSRGGDTTLLLGGRAGHVLAGVVEAVAPRSYDLVLLPDMAAANCVWANGVLVRPLAAEMSAESSLLLDALPGKHVQVATSELAKLDGAITCCSVLIQ
jgi:hypothetical protein